MVNLLEIKNLKTKFKYKSGAVTVVDDISFTIDKGEIVGIVGESGCGKSMTALSIMGLLPELANIEEGSILFCGEDLTKKSRKDMRKICGKQISMIFQEPMTALNPLWTVGEQISETISAHLSIGKKESRERSINLLKTVGIMEPEEKYKCYPHQLSGGMRQRVMIAIALACNPKLIIADEPTTALDVTIQAQILQVMKNLKDDNDMSILMITHDLGIIAEMTEKVIVMYAGQIVEQGLVRDIFKNPRHPYTKGLLDSIIPIDTDINRLNIIEGNVPRPGSFSKGCRFEPRCPNSLKVCKTKKPVLRSIDETTFVRCWIGTEEYNEKENI